MSLVWQYHTTRVYHDNKRYKDAVTKEQVCEAADHGKIALGGAKVEVIVVKTQLNSTELN